MRLVDGVLVLTLALGASLPATALAQQQEQLPPSTLVAEKTPSLEWDRLARDRSSLRGKILVATVAEPKKFVPCKVEGVTDAGVTCKGKHGKVVMFKREQIATLSMPHRGRFPWGDLGGAALLVALGGSAGYGAAVLAAIGGAALFAVPPLALVAAVVGVSLAIYAALSISDDSHETPGMAVYTRSQGTEGSVPGVERARPNPGCHNGSR